MDRSTLQIVLEAKDEMTSELRKTQRELKKLQSQVSKTSSSYKNDMKRMGDSSNETRKNVKTLLGTIQGLGAARLFGVIGAFYALRAAGLALIDTVRKFGEFERLEAGLAAVTTEAGSLEPQLARLREVAKLPGLGFEEAIQGSVNLQAAGLSATQAEAALKAFGNALATVGKGKADLQGVILALTQITAKGKVMGQEILQLQERLPQIRTAMIEAFGTASGEELQKMGISAEDFIDGIVTEFEKLPPVTAGVLNSVENLQDSFSLLQKNIGSILAPTVVLLIDELEGAVSWMTEATNATDEAAEAAREAGHAMEFQLSTAQKLQAALYGLTNFVLGVGKAMALAIGLIAVPAWKTLIIIIQWAGRVVDGFVSIWNTLVEAFKAFKSGDFAGVKDAFAGTFDGLGEAVQEQMDMDMKNINDGMDGLVALAESALGNLKEAWTLEDFEFATPLVGAGIEKDIIAPVKDATDEAKKFAKEVEGVINSLNRINDIVERSQDRIEALTERYKDIRRSGSEAIARLKEKTKASLDSISESIGQVNSRMVELRQEFEKQKRADAGGLASAFADAEDRIKDLRFQLARATDVQQIFDIKTQIKEEEDALARTTETQKQFASEIAEAKRRAGLSEIERAIEDYNTRRELATQELNAQLSNLEAEKSALRDKAKLEKELRDEAIAKVREETKEKLAEINKEKKAVLEQALYDLQTELLKSNTIAKLAETVGKLRQTVQQQTHDVMDETVNEEIRLYERLARQIERAASARERLGGGRTRSNRDTGGSIQQTGLYRLHQGETVLTRRETANGFGGIGGGMTINISGGNFLSEDVAIELGNHIVDRLQLQTRINE